MREGKNQQIVKPEKNINIIHLKFNTLRYQLIQILAQLFYINKHMLE